MSDDFDGSRSSHSIWAVRHLLFLFTLYSLSFIDVNPECSIDGTRVPYIPNEFLYIHSLLDYP